MREHSNKKRLGITVCDEMVEHGFHGFTQKTIISLQLLARSVPIFGARKLLRFTKWVSKKKFKRTEQIRIANKKTKPSTVFCSKSSFRLRNYWRTPMAPRFASGEIAGDGNRNRLPAGEQKSKIPIRITRLNNNSNGQLFSGIATEKMQHLSRNSVDKHGNKRPSRIPIKTECKKRSPDRKELHKNTKSARDQKRFRKDSGIENFFSGN